MSTQPTRSSRATDHREAGCDIIGIVGKSHAAHGVVGEIVIE